MTNSEPSKHSASADLLNALLGARDSVRLQVHLLSMEAKQRWQQLESNLENAEAKQGEEGAASKLRDLIQAVKDFRREGLSQVDLQTPVRSLLKGMPSMCSPDDPLSHVAKLLWETDCGAIPVVDERRHVVGMITDRDLCMAAYTRSLPLQALTVNSTMQQEVYTAAPTDTLGHLIHLMRLRQVRRVPIVEDKRLIGIVSLADIAQHIRDLSDTNVPSCIALVHAVAGISERRAGNPSETRAAAE
jgi:CBS domain-containing protein